MLKYLNILVEFKLNYNRDKIRLSIEFETESNNDCFNYSHILLRMDII